MLSLLIILSTLSPTTVDELYQEVGEIARSEVNGAPAFVRFSASGDDLPDSTQYVVSARRQNVHSLRLVVRKVRTEQAAARLWADLEPSVRPTHPAVGFSGLPIGSKTRRIEGARALALQVGDGLFVAEVLLVYGPPSTREADKDLVEGITRRTLARCRGLQAQATAQMTVGGTAIGSITGPRGERLVDLQRYTQVLGLQLTTNQQRGTASFTSGGEMVIIPLAAKRIKDGPRWIDTSDISLIKDGKWYVSYAALQEARGQ